MSTKHSKYIVNQKLEHVDDISFRELFGRIRVVFYKLRSTDIPHTLGYKQSSFSRQLVPLFVNRMRQGLLKKNEEKLA
jgi:hypothetical protein